MIYWIYYSNKFFEKNRRLMIYIKISKTIYFDYIHSFKIQSLYIYIYIKYIPILHPFYLNMHIKSK